MSELTHPCTIRAHHLLCTLGFRGLGYSEEFTSRMRNVVEKLRCSPVFPLTLVVGCDIICAACPHSKEGECLKDTDSEAKAISLDLEILSRLGFEPGAQVPCYEAWERIRERMTSEDMVELCSDCEWFGLGYCVEGLERLKSGELTMPEN